MKKVTALLLIAVMLFSLAACSPSSNTSSGGVAEEDLIPYEPSEDAHTAVGSLMEPQGLDLNAVTFFGTFTVGWFMYDPLLKWDSEKNEAIPNVITEWEIVDSTTINITIRDDVYSHNGYKIITEDLLYTFERVKATPAIEEYAAAIDVDNCIIVDETNMVIKLLHPSPDQFMYFTQLCMSATSKAGMEAAGGASMQNTNPIACSGPYKFVDWVRGSHITVERNEDYWGEMPYYKTMEIRFISDNSARLMALQAGDIDASGQLVNLQLPTIESDPNLTLFEHEGSTFYYMMLNNSVSPLDNVKVRQAINMAVDRETILETVFGGHGTVMDSAFTSASGRYSPPSEESTVWTFDVDAAKALLAEAGYPNGFEMTIMTLSHQDCIDIAEYMTGALGAIGITVKVEMVETTTANVRMASGEFDAYIISNAGVHGDTGTLRMYDSRLGYADGCYSQYVCSDTDAFYDLLDEFYVELDPDKSKALAEEIMIYIRDEVPAINLVSSSELAATRSNVTGIENVLGNVIMTHIRPSNMRAPGAE